MRFIQTLYFDTNNDPIRSQCGWIAPEYHLMSWALSCLQLKNLYKDVYLYCNTSAAKLLIEDLKLPYTAFYETHNDLDIPDKNLWALPKIYTYSLQHEPFLHIDGDVFLFNKLPDSLLNGGLIAQNRETATDYYTSAQQEMMEHFSYFPDCVKNDFDSGIPINAVNAGILGGNNTRFIHEYSDSAFEYVNRNISHLSSVDTIRFNVFFEQHLFYSMAVTKNLAIDYLFQDITFDNEYENLSDFHETPFKKYYCHLLGHYKKDIYTCRQMASKLRQLYPEYYHRVVSLYKKRNISFGIKKEYDKKWTTLSDYLRFNQSARQHYRTIASSAATDTLNRSNNPVNKQKEIPDIELLKKFISLIDYTGKDYTSRQLLKDFEEFSKNISNCIVSSQKQFSFDYLYGRDLDSANWFAELFKDESQLFQKSIARCPEIEILSSEFDWAGLLNQNKRAPIRYYQTVELRPDLFYSLYVPEIYEEGLSLYDIDDTEKNILDCLSRPMRIEELFFEMQQFVDEDVLENHLSEYHSLLITFIKQLVLRKAIRPTAT